MSENTARIPEKPGARRPRPRRQPATTSRLRLATDRVARISVTAGGLTIIASILGILIFIALEVVPLFGGATVETRPTVEIDGAPVQALLVDEYRTHVATLGPDGVLRAHLLEDGSTVLEQALAVGDDGGALPLRAVHADTRASTLAGITADGRVVVARLSWPVEFDGDRRVVGVSVDEVVTLTVLAAEGDTNATPTPTRLHALVDEDGGAHAVAQFDNGRIVFVRRDAAPEGLLGQPATPAEWQAETTAPALTALYTDPAARQVYGGTDDGRLLWWSLHPGNLGEPRIDGDGNQPAVTALTTLIGDRSLVVGREDGALDIWFIVRQPDESFRLTRVRDFPGERGAITAIAPAGRNRGFVAADDAGRLGLYYSTSERVLWTGPSPVGTPESLSVAPRGNAVLVGSGDRIALLEIDNPHPEVSWRALFGNVWYEGYPEPDMVWQSSGGSDAFEPKLSMTPLMIGTLKGTLYSLLLAVPLGVLGAMYASLFMHPALKRIVKPTVELMAALPSVVLGFLAGLWLAPRVEGIIPALALMLVVLPLVVVASGIAWRFAPASFTGRFPVGSETLLYMVVLSLGIGACLALNGAIERALFGGDFQAALRDATGLPYDQRNAVVVGLAMGFAVIPIIFSIAEDAFSNVPRNLVSGSLALGANAWQTATRVVLPTASPGIFSAIMIGFGRAVGETMIVLMATGNTPIMDWNPFNGFRTLSANIAVEIPEAPFGGTLYRTLFLAALILFGFTFAINTAAELIRQRLRKRYAQL